MAVGPAEWLAAEKVPGKKVSDVAEIQKPDLAFVPTHGVIDEFNDLGVGDPAVRMEAECIDALLRCGGIDGRFHVANSLWIGWASQVLADAIVRHNRRDLPAEPCDDVRIGIVLDHVHETPLLENVLREPRAPLLVGHQPRRQRRIVGREDAKHRRAELAEMSFRRRPPEDFGIEARADCIARVVTGHAKGHRPRLRYRGQQIQAAVVGLLGLRKGPGQKRAGMVIRVGLEGRTLLEPRLDERLLRIQPVGHQAHRRAAVDLLEPFEDRCQERLHRRRGPNIVHGQHNRQLHSRLTDPLGRGQLGRIHSKTVRIARFIEVGQAICIRGESVDGQYEDPTSTENDSPDAHKSTPKKLPVPVAEKAEQDAVARVMIRGCDRSSNGRSMLLSMQVHTSVS